METLKLLIAVFFFIFAGWNILYIISFKKTGLYFWEKAFISYGLGVGFITLEMLLFYFLKMKFSVGLIIAPWLFLFLVNLMLYFKNGGKKSALSLPNAGGNFKLNIFLSCGIAIETIYAFFRALVKPMEAYDAVAIYAIKAKALYLAGSIPGNFFTGTINLFAHPDYPLNIPLGETFIYLFLGSLNDQLVKIIFPLYFTGILGLLYFGIRRFAARTYALVFTFILATIPHFSALAANGYLDLVLAYYCFASALFLFFWFEDTSKIQFFLISAIMIALAGWTKNEGLMYCIINVMLMLIFFLTGRSKNTTRLNLIYFPSYIFIILIISLPWLWIKMSAHLVNDEIQLSNLTPMYILSQYRRVWPIVYEFQKHFFGPKKWNIIWLVFIFTLIVRFKNIFSKGAKYASLYIFFAFGGYILIYMITSANVTWHLSSTASRFLLHFLPVVVYWLAIMLKKDIDI